MKASVSSPTSSSIAAIQDVEKLPVLYSGSIQIPVCVGTVAVPLHSSQSRNSAEEDCLKQGSSDGKSEKMHTRPGYRQKNPILATRFTHRRYCYIRDGCDLAEDAFYRWLNVELANHALYNEEDTQEEEPAARMRYNSASNDINGESAERAYPQRKLHRSDESAERNVLRTEKDNSSRGLDGPSESNSPLPKSPSFFYAMVHHVVFIVPNSFPQPRRVLYEPPFIIQDDSWAEHLVEIQVFFQPHLCIPPISLLQRAFLYKRDPNLTPLLQAQPLGHQKPPSVPDAMNVTATNSSVGDSEYEVRIHSPVVRQHSTTVTEKVLTERNLGPRMDASTHTGDPSSSTLKETLQHVLNTTLIVERQDEIKIWHPTLPVLQFWRAILSKNDDTTVHDLRGYFMTHVYDSIDVEGTVDLNALNKVSVKIYCKKKSETNVKRGDSENTKESREADTCSLYVPKSLLSFLAISAPLQTSCKGQEETLQEHVNGHAWNLPFELVILVNASQKSLKAIRVLDHTLQNLLEEQNGLLLTLDQVITRVMSTSQHIQEELHTLHRACLSLSPLMNRSSPQDHFKNEELMEADESTKTMLERN